MNIVLKSTRNMPWLLDFIREHHSTMPDDLKPKKLSDIECKDTYWYRIYVDGEVVGMTSYQHITPNLAYIKRTIIHKDHRGKGIAKEVWKLTEKMLHDKNYGKVFCHIFTHNIPMIIVRLKMGFLVEGLNRHHDDIGVHQYVLGKII